MAGSRGFGCVRGRAGVEDARMSACDDDGGSGSAALAALPGWLGERVTVVSRGERGGGGGALVLCWLHHAVRGHENPAVDAAVIAARELGLPLLVYQGLGGGHRYDSARHHRFILEGARDAAEELGDRGVRFAFHLPRERGAASPIVDLARRSALVVTEDFPAPPMPAWTERLASRSGTAVWAVDAACVVPMGLVRGVHDRAFRFRRAIEPLLRDRLESAYDGAASACVAAYDGDLGFEPVDLASADLDALIAGCEVDQTLPAVVHTPGGSRSGYARWDAFVGDGLRGYAKRRNDAARDGVSRMSAYLHHGHVSPMRIAREAWAVGGEGAEKFIDELIVWRELAHHFCRRRWRDLETLAVLPGWARETLEAHADDARPMIVAADDLRRGRTGDRLWDAAQRSLVVHGELHNNVRMTWAKALLGWTRGPADALAALIDLNHRFALDGSDPNSYGGLLWALGVFDRPFEPERPVLGTVRSRPTVEHARRLDMDRYERKVSGPAAGGVRRVAVIGAGIAGATAARALMDQGHEVVVWDKGRGPGGRMSRRRTEWGGFDHGAQYFTARDERFAREVRSWCDAGAAARWEGVFAEHAEGGLVERPVRPGGERYVGTPGMNAVVKRVARDVPVRWGRLVERVAREGEGWRIEDDSGGVERAEWLVMAAPAANAAALLGGVGGVEGVARACGAVRMWPCWSVMAAFEDRVSVDADGVTVRGDAALSWAARDSSKPGREPGERWVLHAGPAWSREHEEDEREDVAGALTDRFAAVFGVRSAPAYVAAHRWRYALVDEPIERARCHAPDARLTLAGDWCGGGKVEAAYLSGAWAAGRVLAALAGAGVRGGG